MPNLSESAHLDNGLNAVSSLLKIIPIVSVSKEIIPSSLKIVLLETSKLLIVQYFPRLTYSV